MKKNSILCFILLATLFFVGCQSNDDGTSLGGYGKIMVDLGSDISYSTSKVNQKGTLDLTPYSDVSNYTVELVNNESGEVVLSKLYSQMGLTQEVSAGSYTIRAFYGENVNAAYDKLYVEGSQMFTVSKGDVETISFVCIPANVKVKVQYSDDFFNYYSDCTIGLKTQYLESPFLIKKEDIDKELYMKAALGGEDLTVTFDLKDKNGNPITPKDFGAQLLKIKPRDFLTITVKPKLIEVEGGKIEGITVSVDDGVTEEDVNITVPDDYLPGQNTEVNN